VCGAEGGKLTDARKINALKQALTEVLDQDSAEIGANRRLQRARASSAR
jgi:hypothetical protein